MSVFLGLDTSNYTTSAAVYDLATGEVQSVRRLLEVKPGELGLRQSDALFAHVTRLPQIVRQLAGSFTDADVAAIGVSSRPRAVEGSYMPCFLAGVSQARVLAEVLGGPVYEFSHQQGHVAGGAWSAGLGELLVNNFLALHISGGTTELLHVAPDGDALPKCERIGGSRDLAAGQLVDRCGKLLGLGFPAGPKLETLAHGGDGGKFAKVRLDGFEFSLSVVENQIERLKQTGNRDCDVAAFTIATIREALAALIGAVFADKRYAGLPLLCVGGVMSNKLIRSGLGARFGAFFAEPEYSADNAAGAALLAARAYGKGLPSTDKGVLG